MTFWRISRESKIFKKTISILVAAAFIFSNIPTDWKAFAADLPTDNPAKLSKQQEIITAPSKMVIPRDFGLVKSTFNGNSGKLVIHIQDAHCNYEAQSNIVKMLEGLVKNYDLGLISVEGADGEIDTSWFKAFPDEDVRKEVADYFMRKGEITGPEFLSITTDYPIKLFGAETRSYYIQNLSAFTSSYPLKEETEKYYNSVRGALNRLKGYIYSEDLKAMDARLADYESKKTQFNDYIRFLQQEAEKYKINLRAYDNLFKLISVLIYEKKIDFNVVDKERSSLIDELSRTISKDALKELVEQSMLFKVGKISSAEYYDYLRKLSVKNNMELLQRFPNLSNYIIYNSIYSRVENEKLFRDIKEVEIAIKEKLFANDDQRTLEKLSRHIEILLGLVNIKLLNGDFDYYQAHKEEFSHEEFSKFIKDKTIQYGLAYEVEPPSDAVDNNIPRLEEFYAIAIKRDKAIVDNTLDAMEKNNEAICVLVTGGFHSEGIAKLLEKNGISYAVVCPSITKDVPTLYIQILTNQRTNFEDILAGTVEPVKGTLQAPLVSKLAPLHREDIKKLLSMPEVKDPGLVDRIIGRADSVKEAWISLSIARWLIKIFRSEGKSEGKNELVRDKAFMKDAYLLKVKSALRAAHMPDDKIEVFVDGIKKYENFDEIFGRVFDKVYPQYYFSGGASVDWTEWKRSKEKDPNSGKIVETIRKGSLRAKMGPDGYAIFVGGVSPAFSPDTGNVSAALALRSAGNIPLAKFNYQYTIMGTTGRETVKALRPETAKALNDLVANAKLETVADLITFMANNPEEFGRLFTLELDKFGELKPPLYFSQPRNMREDLFKELLWFMQNQGVGVVGHKRNAGYYKENRAKTVALFKALMEIKGVSGLIPLTTLKDIVYNRDYHDGVYVIIRDYNEFPTVGSLLAAITEPGADINKRGFLAIKGTNARNAFAEALMELAPGYVPIEMLKSVSSTRQDIVIQKLESIGIMIPVSAKGTAPLADFVKKYSTLTPSNKELGVTLKDVIEALQAAPPIAKIDGYTAGFKGDVTTIADKALTPEPAKSILVNSKVPIVTEKEVQAGYPINNPVLPAAPKEASPIIDKISLGKFNYSRAIRTETAKALNDLVVAQDKKGVKLETVADLIAIMIENPKGFDTSAWVDKFSDITQYLTVPNNAREDLFNALLWFMLNEGMSIAGSTERYEENRAGAIKVFRNLIETEGVAAIIPSKILKDLTYPRNQNSVKPRNDDILKINYETFSTIGSILKTIENEGYAGIKGKRLRNAVAETLIYFAPGHVPIEMLKNVSLNRRDIVVQKLESIGITIPEKSLAKFVKKYSSSELVPSNVKLGVTLKDVMKAQAETETPSISEHETTPAPNAVIAPLTEGRGGSTTVMPEISELSPLVTGIMDKLKKKFSDKIIKNYSIAENTEEFNETIHKAEFITKISKGRKLVYIEDTDLAPRGVMQAGERAMDSHLPGLVIHVRGTGKALLEKALSKIAELQGEDFIVVTTLSNDTLNELKKLDMGALGKIINIQNKDDEGNKIHVSMIGFYTLALRLAYGDRESVEQCLKRIAVYLNGDLGEFLSDARKGLISVRPAKPFELSVEAHLAEEQALRSL